MGSALSAMPGIPPCKSDGVRIVGGPGSLPPAYLSVPGFENCVGEKSKGTYSVVCLPIIKPDACAETSWSQIRSDSTMETCDLGPAQPLPGATLGPVPGQPQTGELLPPVSASATSQATTSGNSASAQSSSSNTGVGSASAQSSASSR